MNFLKNRMKSLFGYRVFIFIIISQVFPMPEIVAQFEVQGHRGCRGVMPENTIPAFLKAVESGVTTLELDVVITSDNQVLVSHDPFMSHEICKTPAGLAITEKEEKSHNIYKMSAYTAQLYDCGETVNIRFPEQTKMKVNKPLLRDVIDSVENFVRLHNLKPVWYNIETKCTPGGDNIFHPDPGTFSDLLMAVVEEKNITNRTIIQSFDVRTLQYLKQKGAAVKYSLLIENLKGISDNLEKLGFKPDVYSPHYKLIDENKIEKLHADGIRVIPWTVNEPDQMKKLIDQGADGIITDFPERLVKVIKSFPH